MSLVSRLFDAVRSWRRRPGGPRATKRTAVSLEQLDHRQLLSVNFTGNVATDFPASMTPGVVVLPDNPNVTHPTIAPGLQNLVRVSGFDINGIRATYTPATDTLSVGLQQPNSQQPGRPGPVIAGDADNNGDDGTVSQAVLNVAPTFQDFPDFGGSEYMAAFLDLKGTGHADVLAGFAINDPRSPKEYQVANAVVNPALPPSVLPDFGTMLPLNIGNVYKVNSPNHPGLEFDITHFSQLFLAETGTALTANSVIRMGAYAGSQNDTGIGEAFFPEQSFTLAQATPPTVTPPTCPPASPPVIINIHENRHINTAHPTDIRVNVLGSSGFDVTKIDPATVTLGGAHPIFAFDRFINQDEFLDATFVFKGTDVVLPRGFTEATVSGKLTDGTSFSSSVKVFNRDRSFYTPAQNRGQMQRQLGRDTRQNGFAFVPAALQAQSTVPAAASAPLTVSYEPARTPRAPTVKIPGVSTAKAVKVEGLSPNASPRAARIAAPKAPVVAIPRRQPASTNAAAAPVSPRISQKMQSSINRMARNLGPVSASQPAAANGAY
jgi:hypothetical protein